jgi:1-deoxy-D-xylulose-5-phosphate synthase
VVVNDNRMSISKNVGALSQYMTRLRTAPTYHRLESEVWEIMGKIPAIGEKARDLASRALEGMRGVFVPGILFEEIGFKYYGPLDGHNIGLLIEALERVKHIEGPVLLHAITVKGKGYQPAEDDASRFHGLGSFDKATGSLKASPKAISYTEAFGRTLASLADDDPSIVAITAAMPAGTGLTHFAKRHPERFYDVGIAEQHAVTFAAGLATEGVKPVVALYSSFLQRAYDQVIHDVCLQNLPVRFMIDRGGIVGDDGPTHHGVFDLSFLRTVPNLVLASPKDENELAAMVRTAMDYDDGPFAVRYARGAGLGVRMDLKPAALKIGKAERLRSGTDVCLLAIGSMVATALEAAEELAQSGIHASVVNARFVKPLDRELILEEAVRTGHVVTIEENVIAGGFGAAVMELLQAEGVYGVRVRVLGIPDEFLEHASRTRLLAECRLTSDDIAGSARQLLRSEKGVSEKDVLKEEAGR